MGKVGQLSDVQLVAIPKSAWAEYQEQIMGALQSAAGIQRVDVQDPKQRSKRSREEF